MRLPSDVGTSTRFPVLTSYPYLLKRGEDIDYYLSNPNVEIMLDSGAFTVANAGETIALRDYMDFLNRWRSKLFAYITLDVVGDPEATERNYLELRANGFNPLPVHVRGADKLRMDDLFGQSDLVCLAGLRRPRRGPAPKSYVAKKMEWAAGRPVHWLGYTNMDMIAALRPFSCDCSTWNSPALFGEVDVYLGGGRWSGVHMFGKTADTIPPTYAGVLADMGIPTWRFRHPAFWRRNWARKGIPWSKFVSFQLSAYSWVRYVRDIRARYDTRIFLATTFVFGEGESLFHWIQRTAPNPVPYPDRFDRLDNGRGPA